MFPRARIGMVEKTFHDKENETKAQCLVLCIPVAGTWCIKYKTKLNP